MTADNLPDRIKITADQLPKGTPSSMTESADIMYYHPKVKGYTVVRRIKPTAEQRETMIKALNEFALRSTARKMGYDPDKASLAWADDAPPKSIGAI